MTEPGPERQSWRSWLESHALAVAATGAVALVAAVVLGILALGGGADEAAQPPTSTSSPTSSSGSVPATSPISTASNRTVPDTTRGGEGLIAVKIDNAPAARPQIGLGSARFLFEVPVEGGLTRFLGLFAPADVLVGPVRSLRPVDVDLIPGLAGIAVATGGRPFVVAPLEANGVTVVGFDETSSVLQTLERPRPHNLFVNLSQLEAPDLLPGLPEGDLPPPAGSAETVTIPYASPVTWDYGPSGYERSVDGEATTFLPHYGQDPLPLVADTVVVMSVGERQAGYTDVNGAQVPDFDVIGSGAVTVFDQGRVYRGVWSRGSLTEPYTFTSPQGREFGLPTGLVFVHLLGSTLEPAY